jgi:putative oxidoreductase
VTRDLLLLRPLAAFGDLALLTARLLTGSFLIHGVLDNILSRARMAEFSDFLAANGFAAPDIMAPLSVWAQFAIGIALILGLLTRWAGLLLAFNFTVGVVMVHLAQGFREIWPAAVLIALGLLFATLGAGRIALDRLLERTS